MKYFNNIKTEGVMNSLQPIWRHSELAVNMTGHKFVLGELYPVDRSYDGLVRENGDIIHTTETTGGIGFHPNGGTGCINSCDDYIYDIRCDHLIWMDGYFEGCYSPGILLLGNHKGQVVISAIIFYEDRIS